MDIITYPGWDKSQSMLVKEAAESVYYGHNFAR